MSIKVDTGIIATSVISSVATLVLAWVFNFVGDYRSLGTEVENIKADRLPRIEMRIQERESQLRKALLFVQKMHPEDDLYSVIRLDSNISTIEEPIFQTILQGMKSPESSWRVSDVMPGDIVYLGSTEIDLSTLSDTQGDDVRKILYELESKEESP